MCLLLAQRLGRLVLCQRLRRVLIGFITSNYDVSADDRGYRVCGMSRAGCDATKCDRRHRRAFAVVSCLGQQSTNTRRLASEFVAMSSRMATLPEIWCAKPCLFYIWYQPHSQEIRDTLDRMRQPPRGSRVCAANRLRRYGGMSTSIQLLASDRTDSYYSLTHLVTAAYP